MQLARGSKAVPIPAPAGCDPCFDGNLRVVPGTEQANKQKGSRQYCQRPPAKSLFPDALQASEALPTTSLQSILSNRSSPSDQLSLGGSDWLSTVIQSSPLG